MGVKWINVGAAATGYPTDGRGGADSTAGSSSFVSATRWDNKACILIGALVQPGSATSTFAITSHDGTSDVFTTLTCAANSAPFYIDLLGLDIRGLKVVTTGAASGITVFFDVGQDMTY